MVIVGIDPGVTGAIALLDSSGTGGGIAVYDMPTMLRGRTSKKQQVNAAELARIVRDCAPDLAVVEQVNAMPRVGAKAGMGAASAFNFGHSFGVVCGVLAALGIETHYVTPQVWKKRAGLKGSDKEASRMRAVALWPQASLARKKDSGRAEALLIARFAIEARISK